MKQEDFITLDIKDGIATLWLDHKIEKTNVVSPALIGIFDQVFNQIENDNNIKATVIISAKDDFIAGADIKAFSIEKEGEFRPFQAKGHTALEKLEKGKKPVVAAIHGACLGLGTEIALACHARICSDAARTKMALPEVMLGLLPGGGGTQRLPRLIGIQKALDMMLTGKNIAPKQALKMGLVDEITDVSKLHYAAIQIAKKLLTQPIERKSKLTLTDKLLEGNPLGRSILFGQAKKIAAKKTQGNYPAVPAIIDCVETGMNKGLKAGYEKELDHFEKLILSPESAALRSLFFLMTDNKKNPYSDKPKPLRRLGMIGAGFMGAGITEVSVTNGIEVILKDIKDEVIIAAEKQIWSAISKRVFRKRLSKTDSEKQIASLRGQLTYDNFENVDIVIEAVLEEMSLKKRIIKDIETNCKKDVVIATNTSSLSVTEMASHALRPEQVIGMHYFSPVPKMPLLEIVKTDKTSKEVIASCYEFGLRQGKTVIVVHDGPGFYVNRILGPYLNECLTMIDEGVAFDVIDKAMTKKGFPVGPITLLDEVGLDIAAHVTESTKPLSAQRPGVTVSEGVVKMAKAGRLGKKNKKGFYKYDEKGKRTGPDTEAYKYFAGSGTKTLALDETQNRAIMLLLNEAVHCLEDGIIAEPKDGDLGAVFGIGFLPFTGGPFRAMDTWGIANVVNTMKQLESKYGVRFAPAKTLVEMVAKGSKFHQEDKKAKEVEIA